MPVQEVLACGGELKNTLCLTKDHYAILSQHIGDLENMETMEFFRETLGHLKRFFRVSPVAVAPRSSSQLLEHPLCSRRVRFAVHWSATSSRAYCELYGRQ